MRINSISGSIVLLLGLMIESNVWAQQLSWELVSNGQGISNHQELVCVDFKAGSGLSSFAFGATGATAKSWSTAGVDTADYFQIALISTALDTFELSKIEYSERRSGTGIRNYEVIYYRNLDLSTPVSLGIGNVPDNDLERDSAFSNLDILVYPQDTIYIRWYGYNAEGSTGTWRINDASLKIYLETYVVDLEAPVLSTAMIINANQVEMWFDESLDTNFLAVGQFEIDGLGHPSSVTKTWASQGKIVLNFTNVIPEEQQLTLRYNNLTDSKGNTINQTLSTPISYYIPKSFCLIINEIMTDPSPTVYLPEAEYIEIYNPKPYLQKLDNWTLKIGSTSKTIPNCNIDSLGYLLIVFDTLSNLFDPQIDKIEMDMSLSNTSGTIVLKSPSGQWIHQVNYTDDWHTATYKAEGGWSMELIDPNQACNFETNWTSSISNSGGTPGVTNSVIGQSVSLLPLIVDNAFFVDSSQIKVQFNQLISPIFQAQKNQYQLEGHIADSVIYNIGSSYLLLNFNPIFDTNVVYTLSIADTIDNCSGQILEIPQNIRIGIPEAIDSNDVLFSEIMFNALGDGSQFIEFFNRSSKIIDLSETKIAIFEDNQWTPKNILFSEPRLVFPNDYFVLTRSSSNINASFTVKNRDRLFETENVPSISTTEDRIAIVNKGDKFIDQAAYNAEWHSPLLTEIEGVSLERVSFNKAAIDAASWQSAAQTAGFGTPTYQNSQFYESVNQGSDYFGLSSASFSPDLDGYNDILLVSYRLPQSGYLSNVSIYSVSGHLIKNLSQNEYLGLTGDWTWDGRNQENQISSLGIYLIVFQLTHPNGDQINEKKVITLAGKIK